MKYIHGGINYNIFHMHIRYIITTTFYLLLLLVVGLTCIVRDKLPT